VPFTPTQYGAAAMTRKHRYFISATVLVACACVALGMLAMLPPQPGVTKANFDRIENGMTLQEVERILAAKGVYFNGGTTIDPRTPPPLFWLHVNGMSIAVQFNNAKVTSKHFRESTETAFDKVRRWLHFPK
jgi:hypothetical protein